MTRETLELQRNALWSERNKLDNQMYELEKQMRATIIENINAHVGKTFRRQVFTAKDGPVYEYAIIVAAPYESFHNVIRPDFNEYQIPAMTFVERSLKLSEYTTLFTGDLPKLDNVRRGHDLMEHTHWELAPKEEFDKALAETLRRLYEKMTQVSSSDRDLFKKIYQM